MKIADLKKEIKNEIYIMSHRRIIYVFYRRKSESKLSKITPTVLLLKYNNRTTFYPNTVQSYNRTS
jgi:hypothetical protein